ncbi:hypothetical protein ACF0H5_014964 [Mactra antiquata]
MQRDNNKITTVVKERSSANTVAIDLGTGRKYTKTKHSKTTSKQSTENKKMSIGWLLKYTQEKNTTTPVEIENESGSDSEVEDIGATGLQGYMQVSTYQYTKTIEKK